MRNTPWRKRAQRDKGSDYYLLHYGFPKVTRLGSRALPLVATVLVPTSMSPVGLGFQPKRVQAQEQAALGSRYAALR